MAVAQQHLIFAAWQRARSKGLTGYTYLHALISNRLWWPRVRSEDAHFLARTLKDK